MKEAARHIVEVIIRGIMGSYQYSGNKIALCRGQQVKINVIAEMPTMIKSPTNPFMCEEGSTLKFDRVVKNA